jgi:hypothetical protein
MGIIISKFEQWKFDNVHRELEANNKRFGLVYFQAFEWGGCPSTLFVADTMQEIRDKIMGLTNGQYSWPLMDGTPHTSDDFHSMKFEIYKSHHIQFI